MNDLCLFLFVQDEITSPLNAQIFEFCESELFPETLQNSEVASNSNCCYEEHSSYPPNHHHSSILPPDMNQFTNATTATTILNIKDENPETPTASTPPLLNPTTAANQSNLSVVFDSTDDIENDISVSIDFITHPTTFSIPQYLNNIPQDHHHHHQFDFSSFNNPQNQLTDPMAEHSSIPSSMINPAVLMGPPNLPPVYEEECLSAVPPYMRLSSTSSSSPNSACTLLDPTNIGQFLPGNLTAALTTDHHNTPGIFNGSCIFLGTEFTPQELEFQGESGGMFCPDPMQRVYNCPNELQVFRIVFNLKKKCIFFLEIRQKKKDAPPTKHVTKERINDGCDPSFKLKIIYND